MAKTSAYISRLGKALILMIAFSHFDAFAQPKTYVDYRKNRIDLPLGTKSFADEVVSFKNGNPPSTGVSANPHNCLGEPDFAKHGDIFAHTSLGCGGELILKFTDNALIDKQGADLYIFEVGVSVEPTSVSISKNNIDWVYLGAISGGMVSIDLAGRVSPDDIFYYVKLTDLRSRCGSEPTKGADIDAVAAIGTMKIQQKSDDRQLNYVEKIATKESTINVEIWDNQIEDGDTITLKLNGKVILSNYRVTKEPKQFKFTLTEDDNDFIMWADNLGSKPPNTAAFKFTFDGQEKTTILHSDMNSSAVVKILRK